MMPRHHYKRQWSVASMIKRPHQQPATSTSTRTSTSISKQQAASSKQQAASSKQQAAATQCCAAAVLTSGAPSPSRGGEGDPETTGEPASSSSPPAATCDAAVAIACWSTMAASLDCSLVTTFSRRVRIVAPSALVRAATQRNATQASKPASQQAMETRQDEPTNS
jgi:hypothetical protein